MLASNGTILHKAISDDLLPQLLDGQVRLRQTPGPSNVLGIAKFAFPNEFEIYMHGTSAPWLFKHPRRDLSHGCIRVEQPLELVEWVLKGETTRTQSDIRRAIQSSETTAFQPRESIQVVTIYVMAVVLENGEVHFSDDVYGQDKPLEESRSATSSE
jgi:murein L,D-transpeptidase YcbB/YkuD